jgi:hypothetical protein
VRVLLKDLSVDAPARNHYPIRKLRLVHPFIQVIRI